MVYLTYPLNTDTGCLQLFFCFTYNTATNNPVHMSLCTRASSVLILDAGILYLSIIPVSWNSGPSVHHVVRLMCVVDIFLSLVWIVHSMKLLSSQIIEQSLQSVDIFTPPGKSKVSAAWE